MTGLPSHSGPRLLRPIAAPRPGAAAARGIPPAWRERAAVPARAALLWLSRQERLQRLTAEFPPARRMARRFVAGETRAQALAAAATLARDGMRATLAFLGEHTTDPHQARAAATEYETLLRDLAAAGIAPNCSLKLTQLGLPIAPDLAEEGLRRVLAVAEEVNGFVRIDMEGSDTLAATFDLFQRVAGGASGQRRLGLVIQAYLRRSEADVRRLVAAGTPIRLVKGAYAEPPSIAYARKAEVDASYVRLASLLLRAAALDAPVRASPAFATHDPAMIAAVRRLARRCGVPANAYEFQMLLGVRRDVQIGLRDAGFNVRLYVPYGSQWYPYLVRRLAERPANVLFLARNALRR